MKKASALILMVLLGASVLAAQSSKEWEKGKKAFDRRDFAEAAAFFKKAAEADPRNGDNYRWLGHAYRNNGQNREAIGAYEQALSLLRSKESQKECWYGLAIVYVGSGRMDQAISSMKECVERFPDYAEGFEALAKIYNEAKRYDDAIAAAKRAIELKPGKDFAINQLGYACWKRKRYGESFAWLKKAITINPTAAFYHLDLGGLYYELENYDAAIGEFTEADRLQPGNNSILNELGSTYLMVGRWDDAIRAIDKYFADQPQAATAKEAAAFFGMRSIAHRHKGSLELAARDAEMANSLNPDSGWTIYSLGGVNLDRGRYEESIALLSKAKTFAGEATLLATAFTKLGRTQEALDACASIPEGRLTLKDVPLSEYRLALLKALGAYAPTTAEREKFPFVLKGTSVDAKDENGCTPLHKAAGDGQDETVLMLIAKGADVNAVDTHDRTPLHYAASQGRTETAELLIENGADIFAKDDSGRTPLQSAAGGTKEMLASMERLHEKANPVLAEATRKVFPKVNASPSRRLNEINSLKMAFIDPHTRRVRFIGTYDRAYASGPIAYADLLADALADPYPSFSLDEGQAGPAVQAVNRLFDKELSRVATDPAYGMQWMQNTIGAILRSRDPIPERLILEQRLRGLGIDPRGFAAYIDLKKTNADFTSEEHFQLVKRFLGQLFASVGVEARYGEAAILMSMIAQMTVRGQEDRAIAEGKYQELGEKLGLIDEMQTAVNQRILWIKFYRNLLLGLGAPEDQVRAMISRAETTRGRWDVELAPAADELQRGLAKVAIQDKLLRSFVLTQAYLGRMYSLPMIYSGARLYGRRADSPLVRAMFDADYALKYVTTLNPDTAALPGHLSTAEFLSAASERLGRSSELKQGYLREWIYPGELVLEPFRDKSGVRFASASLRIGVEPMDKGLKEKAWLQPVLKEYADRLSGRFDQYARLYPSLHVMREAEKVIALARWIKQNGLAVDLPGPRPAAHPVPERIEGFVELTFVQKASGATDDVFVSVDGGVSFDRKEGEGWVKVVPAVTTSNDVLEQLAASVALSDKAAEAALGGNVEAARDLAQHSADAMIGLIDTSDLPAPVAAPALAADESVAGRAEAALEAIATVEENVDALARAQSDLRQAEAFQASDPARYEQARRQAQAAMTQPEQNLRHLQSMMAKYHLRPDGLPSLVVDMRQPDQGRPPQAAGPSRPAAPAAGPAKLARFTLHNEEDAEKIRAKIASLQQDAKLARLRMATFSRALFLNHEQYEAWLKTIEESFANAKESAIEFGWDLLLESSLGLLDRITQKNNYALLDRIIDSKDPEMRLWLGRELRDRHIEQENFKKLVEWNKMNGDLAGLLADDEEAEKKYLDSILFANDLFETFGWSKVALKGISPGKWFYLTKMAGETTMDAVSIYWGLYETRKLEKEQEQFERNIQWLTSRLERIEEETQCLIRCLSAYTDDCAARCAGKSRYSTPPPPLK